MFCPKLTASHHRDFVRENKQMVSEISRQRNAKHQETPIAKLISSDGHKFIVKREHALNQAPFGCSSVRSSSQPEQIKGGLLSSGARNSQNTKAQLRQRNRKQIEPREDSSPKPAKIVAIQKRNPATRISKAKNPPPIETHNVAVQTDEICDEFYLYSALKKCASPAFVSALKAKYQQKEEESKQKKQQLSLNSDDVHLPPNEGPNVQPEINVHQYQYRETESNGKPSHSNNKKKQHPEMNLSEKNLRPNSQYARRHDGDAFSHHTPNDEVNDLFNVMTLPPELNKKCQFNECINCPKGYHLLTDEERNYIKKKLLERETVLIKQLNSFPLAIETLRVRQTKTRIERELCVLEQNLRKLTKKKVYAKLNE